MALPTQTQYDAATQEFGEPVRAMLRTQHAALLALETTVNTVANGAFGAANIVTTGSLASGSQAVTGTITASSIIRASGYQTPAVNGSVRATLTAATAAGDQVDGGILGQPS